MEVMLVRTIACVTLLASNSKAEIHVVSPGYLAHFSADLGQQLSFPSFIKLEESTGDLHVHNCKIVIYLLSGIPNFQKHLKG